MNKGHSHITAVLIAAVLSVFIAKAPGASRNWGGSIDGDWFKAGNWSPTGAPASTDDLTIGPYLPIPPYPPRPSTTLPVFADGGGSISAVTPMGRAYFDDLTIGDTAAGSMDILQGGDVISDVGYVGRQSTGSGAVNVSGGGSIWDNSATLYIGYDGDGELLVQGGGYVGSASSYIMTRLGSSGSATVTGGGSKWVTDSLYVGSTAAGTGNLTIADGGLVSSSSGAIGGASFSSGWAKVTGANSEWSITGGLGLGSNGAGKLTVGGGGKVRADGTLYLGDGGILGGGGTVDLNSGGLIVTDAVSISSGGAFNIATGSTLRTNRMSGFGNSVTAGSLQLGNFRGATAGAHTVSAGQTFDVNHDFIVGYNAPAAFTQSGGAVTADYEILGYSSTGTYNQSDGTHQIATYLNLAQGFGTVGAYTLSGGSLIVGTEEIVGRGNGPGSFVHTGGTHTVGTDLYLGHLPGPFGGGTYNLSGAPSQLTATNEYIGYENTGVFTQSDGTHQVQDVLYLGHQAGGTGTYNLSGGTLTVKTEYVGYNGTGIFNQTGGTHNVTGGPTLYLGYAAGSSGAYTLDDGNLFTDEVIVAEEGSGTFIQNGGFHDVDGTLYIGHLMTPRNSGDTNCMEQGRCT